MLRCLYDKITAMRTTLQIDEDVYNAAKDIAESEERSIGEVISTLARKGLAPRNYTVGEDGVPIFAVSENAAPMTPQTVKQALEDE